MNVQLRDDDGVVDTVKFRERLEMFLNKGDGPEGDKTFIRAFLAAWDAERKSGKRQVSHSRSSQATHDEPDGDANSDIIADCGRDSSVK